MKGSISAIILSLVVAALPAFNQQGTTVLNNDSAITFQYREYGIKLAELDSLRIADSLKREALQRQLNSLKTTDNLKKEELQKQIEDIKERETKRIAQKKAEIDALRLTYKGYPVFGPLDDTLFMIHSKIGSFMPAERAVSITKKIRTLYEDDFLKIDSITPVASENTYEIVYGEMIIMSISESDALWNNKSKLALAKENSEKIKESIRKAKNLNRPLIVLLRIGLVILVVACLGLIIWLISKGHHKAEQYIVSRKDKWLKSLAYKEYTFLTVEQELKGLHLVLKLIRWFFILLLLYLFLPVVFSIFPFTQGWANILFKLVWSPFRRVFVGIWEYIPNLFSIIVIYIVFKYVIRFVKYVFSEIDTGRLKISGFHEDWAKPTFVIIRFLLYAFMFVLIFPYLPGSDSNIFKGVSVFVGILFSLGSTSAIANLIAGLVITYMRPFKIGDRIRIGEMTGDVIEKTLLVTRLRTIKNEEITIPNSSVLSGNTINYSAIARTEGLIIHTTVTIGYDVPWKDMHQALIDAALKTDMIVKNPKPFVLQTSLDDFYVSYQINGFTHDANKQALIYSNLHQNIQDICNERGIEIMSPHYRAARDGNTSTIPANYLEKSYQPPGFNIHLKTDKP